jgi:hypothetical protein
MAKPMGMQQLCAIKSFKMGVIGHGAHTLFQKNMVLQVLVSQV